MTAPADLLVRSGRVIDPAGGVDATLDVLIRDGRVVALGTDLGAELDAALPVLDAAGLVVTPGFVDLHTHLREPGFKHKETIATGTLAAARGGYTTVCAMANTDPTTDSAAVVAQVLERARGAPARVLPVGAITKRRLGKELSEMEELRAAGVVAFSDDGEGVADAGVARRAFDYAADLGLPISEHCEDLAIAGEGPQRGAMHEGAVSARLGLRGQPVASELAMLERDIGLAELTGVTLHLAHVSTAPACAAVAAAKARGLRLSAEVAPHHLFLTDAAVAGNVAGRAGRGLDPATAYDTNAKVAPPLRPAEHVAACIAALAAGVLDAVATDHAPHALPDKRCEFQQAAYGISGLETAFGVLGTLVAEGKLTLGTVIDRLTIGPVRAWGLDRDGLHGLGTLAPGAPGDLAIVDPAARWTVDPEQFASLGKNTPLTGRELTGRVVATVLGGRVVFDAAAEGARA